MTKAPFDKIVVWGHKLGHAKMSNTFAFIHNSWAKTFKHLGNEVLWLDDNDDVSNISFENCLFFTEGQVDNKIPIVKSSKYVLHNCFDLREKYGSVLENCLNIGPYNGHIKRRKVQQLDKDGVVFYQPEPDWTPNEGCDNRTLHQPWATDLLPHEIDPDNTFADKYQRQKKVFWVGSICGGSDGNIEELNAFAAACYKGGTPFIHAKLENNLAPRAVAESWVAPAIQGAGQVKIDYVPCRVFKNISYGKMPLTNCPRANELFGNKLIFSPDMQALYDMGVSWEQNPDKETLKKLMTYVRENHTYVNRVETILKVL